MKKNSPVFLAMILILTFISFGMTDEDGYTGKNVMSCKVNDKVVKSRNRSVFCRVIKDSEGASFIKIGLYNRPVSSEYEDPDVMIILRNIDPDALEKTTYVLSGDNGSDNYGFYFRNISTLYKTTNFEKGELVITHFDPVNRIIGGTFWFDAKNISNGKGPIYKITEGKFDLKMVNAIR